MFSETEAALDEQADRIPGIGRVKGWAASASLGRTHTYYDTRRAGPGPGPTLITILTAPPGARREGGFAPIRPGPLPPPK